MKTFDLCTECGKRIPVNTGSKLFHGTRLCKSCVDDLFLNSVPVHQQPKCS
jgi:RNA polymerase-binding transcription factor DksA